jgi:penicillin-binding protein 2
MTEGKNDTTAWFVCFAPYDNPKYTIAVMVQGGEHGGHGGPVAAPIATRILERTLAMDQGTFNPQLAWLAPARKSNPFQSIPAVEFKDSSPKLAASDEENLDGTTKTEMANTTADPDVEPDPDAAGKVAGKKVVRAIPVATPPPRKLSFFERLFGTRPKPAPVPAPTPPPKRPVRR